MAWQSRGLNSLQLIYRVVALGRSSVLRTTKRFWLGRPWKKGKEAVLYEPKTQRLINLEGIKVKGFFLGKNTFVESLVLLDKVNPMQWCDSKKENERKEDRGRHARAREG
jgi:hypothetical protein